MAGISPSRLHAQTAERRLDLMGDMANAFVGYNYWGPDHFYTPCFGNEGLVPLIAGKVDLPEEPEIDGQDIWLYDISTHKMGSGYLVQRPDVQAAERTTSQPDDWSNWSLCTLTERHGLQWLDNGKTIPKPMDVVAYTGLRKLLRNTSFHPGATEAAAKQLGEETLNMATFDAYLRRWLRHERQWMWVASLAGRCATAVIDGLSKGGAIYMAGLGGIALPLPDDPDSDKLP